MLFLRGACVVWRGCWAPAAFGAREESAGCTDRMSSSHSARMLSPRGSPRTPNFATMTEEELSESLIYLTCPICELVRAPRSTCNYSLASGITCEEKKRREKNPSTDRPT